MVAEGILFSIGPSVCTYPTYHSCMPVYGRASGGILRRIL